MFKKKVDNLVFLIAFTACSHDFNSTSVYKNNMSE